MSEEFRCFGPPGTGKTSFLATQVGKWSSEQGSDSIMVASFTRAAAHEIGSRELPLDPKQVGTLHSFAYRALGGTIDIAETRVADWNDRHPGWALTPQAAQVDIEDRDAGEPARGDGEGDTFAHAVQHLRARRVDPEWWPPHVTAFAAAWEEWKGDGDLLDFTDLIDFAQRDTVAPPGAPAIGFFDETQDFTPLELALVRHWGAGMERVVLAGDDDQCVYAFKGATPDAFLDPPVDDEHRRVLAQSYRLPRAVHSVASAWVEQLSRREPKAYAPRDEAGATRYLASASARAPTTLALDIEERLAEGRSVMVLASTGFTLGPVLRALRARALPFHNPYRRRRGDWNPLVPGTAKRRTALDRVLGFLRTQAEVWGGDARWYHGADLRLWIEPLLAKGLLTTGAKTRVDALPGGVEVDVDDFDGLFLPEHLEGAVLAVQAGDLAWLRDHLLAKRLTSFAYAIEVAEARGAATLRETPRVVVGTIHSVKGAEADVVYLAPDISAYAARDLAAGNRDTVDELVRLFYVGMTRARSELVVLAAPAGSARVLDPQALLRGRFASPAYPYRLPEPTNERQ